MMTKRPVAARVLRSPAGQAICLLMLLAPATAGLAATGEMTAEPLLLARRMDRTASEQMDRSWEGLRPSHRWTVSIEVVDDLGDVGEYSSLGVDDQNRLAVAYYDSDNGDLRFALKTGTWQHEIVDASEDVGRNVWLTIDDTGRRNVSYFDATSACLRYAGWLDSAWTPDTEVVEETTGAGNVGEYSSLALDDQNRPAVAYYDSGNEDLKFAVKIGTWQQEIVDPSGDMGRNVSLGIDALGRRNVSYLDGASTSLRYAGWLDSVWTPAIEVVEETIDDGDVGEYSSLAFDDEDHPAVAYYDGGNGDLKFALKSGTWQLEVVDEDGDVGSWPSLCIDERGHANVSYHDSTSVALRYAGWLPGPTSVPESDDPAVEEIPLIPTVFAVHRPHRNPFSEALRVAYDVPAPGYEVEAVVHNVAGRVVSRTSVGRKAPGRYTFAWHGRRSDGSRAASGVYFCTIRIGAWSASRKVVLAR